MRFHDLARALCRREAKKKQVNIAQMSEVLARLIDMIAERPHAVVACLFVAAAKKEPQLRGHAAVWTKAVATRKKGGR